MPRLLKTFEYNHPHRSGVDCFDDHLVWWIKEDRGCSFAGGDGREQTADDFLANGPNVDDVIPQEILDEMRQLLLAANRPSRQNAKPKKSTGKG
ncbi:MAG: hypothetical protein ACRCZF_23575 [Gemmataceae bacterium]